ncbi:hypothetical protein EVAR_38607_1 [Eumeta japonica]|uniref:Uncharacterized protein n=1 Tax=Eumeta variegata TaxID=151549 RepID=A0A4C1WUC2_EUMVA|nr:hypothetical protein EVAR_38607_1 [Eumeta japonica]
MLCSLQGMNDSATPATGMNSKFCLSSRSVSLRWVSLPRLSSSWAFTFIAHMEYVGSTLLMEEQIIVLQIQVHYSSSSITPRCKNVTGLVKAACGM